MASIKKFEAELLLYNKGSGGVFVNVPFDVETAFGAKRPKVKVLFENKIEYRGVLARMGTEHHILIVLKKIREELALQVGDKVKVQVQLDTEERVVTIPAELKTALSKSKKAEAIFNELSHSRKREYAEAVAQAKKIETKIRRADKCVSALLSK